MPNIARLVIVVMPVLSFVPVRYGRWSSFPVWSLIVFLGSLAPVGLLASLQGHKELS